MSKDLFKQAIAEAKSVREAAIANAKEALEESLTPHLKDMLAAKLQEMEDSSVEEEVVNESEVEETIEEAPKEDKKDEAIEEVEIAEEVPAAVAEEEVEEAEDDSEESEDEAEHDEEPAEEPIEDDMPDGDEDISKLSIDQFKDLVRDIIAQEGGHGEEEIPAGDDLDGGDIEGMGDEPAIEEPAMDGAEEEEIDLDELLKELEAETSEEVAEAKDDKEMDEAPKKDDKDENVEEAKEDHKDEGKKDDKKMEEEVAEEVTEESNDLQEALETIETLKKDLNEVNLLNSKLLYVNKIFKSNDLSESQKVNIIAAFDKAESVKEVKLVFETVSDSVVGKKESAKTIKESKTKLGMASKAGGTTAAKPEVISEVSDTVRRMQKLAGII